LKKRKEGARTLKKKKRQILVNLVRRYAGEIAQLYLQRREGKRKERGGYRGTLPQKRKKRENPRCCALTKKKKIGPRLSLSPRSIEEIF